MTKPIHIDTEHGRLLGQGHYLYVTKLFYEQKGSNQETYYTALYGLAFAVASHLLPSHGEALPHFDKWLKEIITQLIKDRKRNEHKPVSRKVRKPNKSRAKQRMLDMDGGRHKQRIRTRPSK